MVLAVCDHEARLMDPAFKSPMARRSPAPCCRELHVGRYATMWLMYEVSSRDIAARAAEGANKTMAASCDSVGLGFESRYRVQLSDRRTPQLASSGHTNFKDPFYG